MNTNIVTVSLNTVFLVAADGTLYELPRGVAEAYAVAGVGDEVGGRHFVTSLRGSLGGHREVLFGTAITEAGTFMTGYHYHPNGGREAVFVDGM